MKNGLNTNPLSQLQFNISIHVYALNIILSWIKPILPITNQFIFITTQTSKKKSIMIHMPKLQEVVQWL